VSGAQTHGFDLVVELSEDRLASIVGLFVIPSSIAQTIDIGGLQVPITVSGRTIPLGSTTIHPGNLVDFHVNYSSVTIAGVALGEATIEVTVQIGEDPATPGQIAVTFPAAPSITLNNPAALDGLLAASGSGLTHDQALALAANALLGYLQGAATLPHVPIGETVGSGPCALALAGLSVRTIDHVLAIMLSFSGSAIHHPSPPSPDAFTSSGLDGRDAVLFVSNDALLGLATCFASQPPSPIAGAAFTAQGECRQLARPMDITLMGHTVSLETLSVCVVGNQVVINGSLNYSGTGFSIGGTFRAPMGFSCRPDGSISLDFNPDDVQTDIGLSIEWWVYLLAFLLAAIFALFSAVIAVVLAIVILIAAPIASAIINSLARGAIGNLGQSVAGAGNTSLLPSQLQRVLGAIHCQAVILDDLNFAGFLASPRVAAVSFAQKWEVTQRVESGQGGTGLFAYTAYRVARRVTLTANPTSMIDPVSWTWKLAGQSLSGSGSRTINGVPVDFVATGASLQLSTPLGANLDFVAAVQGRDRDSLVQSASIVISITPTDVEYAAGSMYNILRILTGGELYPRGVPNLVIDPAGPDPPPDAFIRGNIGLEAVQALAAGMKLNAADLAKAAGVGLGSAGD
jgi:hypothetical protein